MPDALISSGTFWENPSIQHQASLSVQNVNLQPKFSFSVFCLVLGTHIHIHLALGIYFHISCSSVYRRYSMQLHQLWGNCGIPAVHNQLRITEVSFGFDSHQFVLNMLANLLVILWRSLMWLQ